MELPDKDKDQVCDKEADKRHKPSRAGPTVTVQMGAGLGLSDTEDEELFWDPCTIQRLLSGRVCCIAALIVRVCHSTSCQCAGSVAGDWSHQLALPLR